MYEKFSDRARKVMALANQEAQRFNHEYLGTEHILLGLLKEGAGVGAAALKSLDVDLRKVRMEVEKRIKSGPDMVTMGRLPQTSKAKQAITLAIDSARESKDRHIGTEHLLLGIARSDGVAYEVLHSFNITPEQIEVQIRALLSSDGSDSDIHDLLLISKTRDMAIHNSSRECDTTMIRQAYQRLALAADHLHSLLTRTKPSQ